MPDIQRVRLASPAGLRTAPVVFLSHSHSEAATAVLLGDALAVSGLDVIIDTHHLRPSEDIMEFARRAGARQCRSVPDLDRHVAATVDQFDALVRPYRVDE